MSAIHDLVCSLQEQHRDLWIQVEQLEEALQKAREALGDADSAIWDKHYGNGLSVEYARSVAYEINEALGAIKSVLKEKQ